MPSEVTIGQLAKEAKVNVQTVRYYERLKMLAPTTRLASGYRLYGPIEAQRLRFIKNAQSLGFSLQEIAELLNLRVSAEARCGDVQRKAEKKMGQVKAKIGDLQSLARTLRNLIDHCHAGQPTDCCPILKTLEEERRINHGNRQTKR